MSAARIDEHCSVNRGNGSIRSVGASSCLFIAARVALSNWPDRRDEAESLGPGKLGDPSIAMHASQLPGAQRSASVKRADLVHNVARGILAI